MFKPKELDLPITVPGLRVSGSKILRASGYAVNDENLRLFAGWIQQSQHGGHPLTAKNFITALRKALRHQAAFQLIKDLNDSKAAEEASKSVV